jgi:MipA family protein
MTVRPAKPAIPPRLKCCAVAALLAAGAVQAAAQATDATATPTANPPERFDYVLGVAAVSSPAYTGGTAREVTLRPVLAVRWGRIRISSSRGGALLGFGTDAPSPGVSAELFSSDRLRVGLALRGDSGRSVGDDPVLAGLPEIRSTLRARLYAGYQLTPAWGLGASISQDLLGREGGATASADLSYRYRASPDTEWTVGGGASFGNQRYLRNHFGVPASAVATSGYPQYEPGAGLVDLHAGVGVTTLLSRRWVAFAGVGASQLKGDAAASPLTRRARSVSGTVGVAWRCCG